MIVLKVVIDTRYHLGVSTFSTLASLSKNDGEGRLVGSIRVEVTWRSFQVAKVVAFRLRMEQCIIATDTALKCAKISLSPCFPAHLPPNVEL